MTELWATKSVVRSLWNISQEDLWFGRHLGLCACRVESLCLWLLSPEVLLLLLILLLWWHVSSDKELSGECSTRDLADIQTYQADEENWPLPCTQTSEEVSSSHSPVRKTTSHHFSQQIYSNSYLRTLYSHIDRTDRPINNTNVKWALAVKVKTTQKAFEVLRIWAEWQLACLTYPWTRYLRKKQDKYLPKLKASEGGSFL